MNQPVPLAAKVPMMLASAFLSVLLWIYVQTIQPVGFQTTSAPVTILGADKWMQRFVYPDDLNDLKNVDIRIDGPQDQLPSNERAMQMLLRQSKLAVILDLNNPIVGKHNYQLQLEYQRAYAEPFTFTLVQNPYVSLDFEPKAHETSRVVVEAIGQLPKNLNLSFDNATSDPASVTLEGPAQSVNLVKRVRVFFDLSQVQDPSKIYGTPEPLDVNDHVVQDVTVTPTYVKLLPALAPADQTQTVFIQPNWNGHPALGFDLTNYSLEPNQTAVTGPPEVIARLKSVYTQPITIEGIRASTTYEVQLDLPPGVKTLSGRRIKVNVTIEPHGSATPNSSSISGPP